MISCVLIGIGGFFGSVLRYLFGQIPLKPFGSFPIATLAINIVGTFVLALVAAVAAKNPTISQKVVLMLKVGVCGGFTTFSTFAYEYTDLFTAGKYATGALYIVASIAFGMLAVILAQRLIV